jgi:hypothetical protein
LSRRCKVRHRWPPPIDRSSIFLSPHLAEYGSGCETTLCHHLSTSKNSYSTATYGERHDMWRVDTSTRSKHMIDLRLLTIARNVETRKSPKYWISHRHSVELKDSEPSVVSRNRQPEPSHARHNSIVPVTLLFQQRLRPSNQRVEHRANKKGNQGRANRDDVEWHARIGDRHCDHGRFRK